MQTVCLQVVLIANCVSAGGADCLLCVNVEVTAYYVRAGGADC